MRPRAAKALKVMGTAWSVLVVLGYLAMWLFSEHGGGLFSQDGWGEVWLIALICLPGVGLIKLADRMSGLKAEQPSQLRMQQQAVGVGYPVSNSRDVQLPQRAHLRIEPGARPRL